MRDQGGQPSCSIFGGMAVIEAAINLYFNRHLDVDLAEHASISCGEELYNSRSNDLEINPCFLINSPADLICNVAFVGIPDEACYPYVDQITPDTYVCTNLCSDYDSRMWRVFDFVQVLPDDFYTDFVIDEYGEVQTSGPLIDRLKQEHTTEEAIKLHLMSHGPVAAAEVATGHTAAIVGWGHTDFTAAQICGEQEICTDNGCESSCTPGETICKNIYHDMGDGAAVKGVRMRCDSAGTGLEPNLPDYYCADDELCVENGVCAAKSSVPISSTMCVGDGFGENAHASRYDYWPREGSVFWIYKNSFGPLSGDQGYDTSRRSAVELGPVGVVIAPVTPPPGEALSILCRDLDGDSFCNWGLSPMKPPTCPASCQDDPDWNDADAAIWALGLY